MKTLSLISRRSDLTRDAFCDYYEHQHCTLAMRYFPYQRYTRNHLVSEAEPGFDCISEFVMSDEFRAIAGDVMASESRARLLEDELEFMQPERIRVALVQEVVIQPVASKGEAYMRYVLLFRFAQQRENHSDALQMQLQPLLLDTPGLEGASLDTVQHSGERRFDWDALLWLTFSDESAAQAALARIGQPAGLARTLLVSTYATGQKELQDRFERYLP